MKLLLLLPIILALVFASTSIVFAQSSGMTIMASADKGSDTITVVGKTVSDIADVTFRVTSPSGDSVVAIKQLSPNDNGKFMWKLKVTQVWRENGFYKIEATQGVVQNSLYPLHVLVEVNNRMTEKTFVTDSNFGSNLDTPVHNSITVQTDKSSYSKCGAGTVFDKVSNSCMLNGYQGYTGSENSRLKAEIRDLKEQNNNLQSEIRDLRNIIYKQLDTIMKTLQRLN